MTDKQIIKALECCASPVTTSNCGECTYRGVTWCATRLKIDAADLIEKQQKKIEHYKEARNKLLSASKLLSKQVDEQQEKIESLKKTSKSLYEAFEAACDFEYKIRRKAITEFVSKLKSKADYSAMIYRGEEIYESKTYSIQATILDDIVNETVGDINATKKLHHKN